MKRAGEVVRVAQGLAIVRAADTDPPDIGKEVVDETLDEIGRIVDIFGPVDSPYIAISPGEQIDPARLLGEKLYVN